MENCIRYLRKSFNQSGGKIVSRLDWGLPQIHDTLLVRSVSKEEWIEYVLPKLDIKKMIDERSGLPFNDKTIILALDEVYENISTDGFSKFKPSGNRLGRSLHNRRTDHRFLVFKNVTIGWSIKQGLVIRSLCSYDGPHKRYVERYSINEISWCKSRCNTYLVKRCS